MTTHTHKSLTPASQPHMNSKQRNSLNMQELQKSVPLSQATLWRRSPVGAQCASDTKTPALSCFRAMSSPTAALRATPVPLRLVRSISGDSVSSSLEQQLTLRAGTCADSTRDTCKRLRPRHGRQGRERCRKGLASPGAQGVSTTGAPPQRPGAERGRPRPEPLGHRAV